MVFTRAVNVLYGDRQDDRLTILDCRYALLGMTNTNGPYPPVQLYCALRGTFKGANSAAAAARGSRPHATAVDCGLRASALGHAVASAVTGFTGRPAACQRRAVWNASQRA